MGGVFLFQVIEEDPEVLEEELPAVEEEVPVEEAPVVEVCSFCYCVLHHSCMPISYTLCYVGRWKHLNLRVWWVGGGRKVSYPPAG